MDRCTCSIRLYAHTDLTISSEQEGSLFRVCQYAQKDHSAADRLKILSWYSVRSRESLTIISSKDLDSFYENNRLHCELCNSTVFTIAELKALYNIALFSNDIKSDFYHFCKNLFFNLDYGVIK